MLMEKLADVDGYDIAVIGGDILDTHERVDVQLMNRAYELVKFLRDRTVVYLLVGNHDMINNQQFLTDNHWMNGMKEWRNVVVVDRTIREGDIIFVPYVPPGRFVEALDTLRDDWRDATCIFAHQEFRGCKLGVVKSSEGDEWSLDWPRVISGHIHDRHRLQANIRYPGNMEPRIFDIDRHTEKHIPLGLETVKTVRVEVGNIDKVETTTKSKIVVSGTMDELAAFRNGNRYRDIVAIGSTVQFKLNDTKRPIAAVVTFSEILERLIRDAADDELTEDYKYLTRLK